MMERLEHWFIGLVVFGALLFVSKMQEYWLEMHGLDQVVVGLGLAAFVACCIGAARAIVVEQTTKKNDAYWESLIPGYQDEVLMPDPNIAVEPTDLNTLQF